MSTDQIRALCAELAQELAEEYGVQREFNAGDPLLGSGAIELLSRARTALAQSELEGPISESELAAMWNQQADAFNQWESLDSGEQLAWAQARAVSRFARPAIEPVPVSERPWDREGWCDAEGRCWWGRPSEELCNSDWFLATCAEVEEFCDSCPPTVSLPHHALPIPTP